MQDDNTVYFSDWANRWLHFYKKNYVKQSTYVESYKRTVDNYLLPHFSERNIADITPIDIREYLTDMSETYSDSTLSKILICLNGIFNAAVENDAMEKNPAANVKLPRSMLKRKEKQTYSQEEVENIVKYSYNHHNGLYVHILLELGLRCSELCGLKWSDIDFKRKVVNINRACTAVKGTANVDTTKNKSSTRVLPLGSALTERLKEVCPQNLNNYIIVSKRDKISPITPSSFTKIYYNKFFEDYSIASRQNKLLTPHELRHTCGTLLYNRTNDIYAVSKYLGHSNIGTTARLYVHSDPEVLRNSLKIS